MILRWLRRFAACSRAGRKGGLKMASGMPARARGFDAVEQRLDRVARQQGPAADLADQARERREMRSRLAALLRQGAVARRAAAHPGGLALHPVHAEQDVGQHAQRRQQPQQDHPDRRRARLALVDDGVARSDQRRADPRRGEQEVEGVDGGVDGE